MAIWNDDNSGTAFSAVTDEMIQEAERRFGVQLPDAYVEIVKQQNGGSLETNAVPSPSKKIEEPYIEVTEIYGIGEDMGIYDTTYLIQEWELPENIVLFSGTGHAWLAFDYRKTTVNPPIVYIETDDETKVYKLADDFSQFLGMLYIEESEFDEESDDWNEWSEEEFDQLLAEGKNEEELLIALLSVSQSTTDYQWLGQVFLRLSQHQNSLVRNQVAEIVWNGTAPYLEENTLAILLERFEKDEDLDVRQYAQSIRENLNRSYEDWVLSLDDLYDSSALLYQKKSMLLVYKEEGTWALERDGEIVHTSQTKSDLLNNVTIDGQRLKAIWSQLKLV